MDYKKYSKKEFLKILKKDGILFVKTNLGNKYIIKKVILLTLLCLNQKEQDIHQICSFHAWY